MIEIETIDHNNLVLWTRPIKIKDNWYNAILQKPTPILESNIQFIMKSRLFGATETSCIVVSKNPLSLTDINNIDLDNFIFDSQSNFSKGVAIYE